MRKLPPFLPGFSSKLQGSPRRRQLEILREKRDEVIDSSMANGWPRSPPIFASVFLPRPWFSGPGYLNSSNRTSPAPRHSHWSRDGAKRMVSPGRPSTLRPTARRVFDSLTKFSTKFTRRSRASPRQESRAIISGMASVSKPSTEPASSSWIRRKTKPLIHNPRASPQAAVFP